MERYEFKNPKPILYDLLTFALGIPPMAFEWFIANLGRTDIYNLYISEKKVNIADELYKNITHLDKGKVSYDILTALLMGNTRVNEHNITIGNTDAVEDMRHILMILNNPNDRVGQRKLFYLLSEWKKFPQIERSGHETHFARVCKQFLYGDIGGHLRITDGYKKKRLLFKIADNTNFQEKFICYARIAGMPDIRLSVGELQSLYDKMLNHRDNFISSHQQYRDSNGRPLDMVGYTAELLAKTKQRLEEARQKEIAEKKERQAMRRVPKPTVVTYEDLLEVCGELFDENAKLREQLGLCRGK